MRKALLVIPFMALSLAACGSSESSSKPPLPPINSENVQTTISENSSDEAIVESFDYSKPNDEFVNFWIKVHNPTESCIKYPEFRVTAKSSTGNIIATEEYTGAFIYPNQDYYINDILSGVSAEPAEITAEFITAKKKYISESSTEYSGYKRLETVNISVFDDKITGEIKNNNDFDIKTARLSVFCYDSNGMIVPFNGLAIEFVDDIPANSTVPFEIDMYFDFSKSDVKIYAELW